MFVQYESLEILVSKQCSLTNELPDPIIGNGAFLFVGESLVMQSMDCAISGGHFSFSVHLRCQLQTADGGMPNSRPSLGEETASP
jgi:hypothetical protein